MPELPEVETVRRGIASGAVGGVITRVVVRERRLRRLVDGKLSRKLVGKTVTALRRRAKYLIFELDKGIIIAHLGMTGIFFFSDAAPRELHEHIGLQIGGRFLIYKDPRRFGCFDYYSGTADSHPLLKNLGPEPLLRAFNGKVLHEKLRNRKVSIKSALLDGRAVAGVGNIYASESLHLSGIRPQMLSCRISAAQADLLASAIKSILKKAISAGGSTIRSFTHPGGKPGYFQKQCKVYERAGGLCSCGGIILKITQSARSSYYCPRCQK